MSIKRRTAKRGFAVRYFLNTTLVQFGEQFAECADVVRPMLAARFLEMNRVLFALRFGDLVDVADTGAGVVPSRPGDIVVKNGDGVDVLGCVPKVWGERTAKLARTDADLDRLLVCFLFCLWRTSR